jgi:hypothetical protein
MRRSGSDGCRLQTSCAQAVAFSKGFLAEETKAAFERAGELVSHDGGGPLVSLDLDRVRDDRAAIGVRRTRPGGEIRCDRQREMTPRIVTCNSSSSSSAVS